MSLHPSFTRRMAAAEHRKRNSSQLLPKGPFIVPSDMAGRGKKGPEKRKFLVKRPNPVAARSKADDSAADLGLGVTEPNPNALEVHARRWISASQPRDQIAEALFAAKGTVALDDTVAQEKMETFSHYSEPRAVCSPLPHVHRTH